MTVLLETAGYYNIRGLVRAHTSIHLHSPFNKDLEGLHSAPSVSYTAWPDPVLQKLYFLLGSTIFWSVAVFEAKHCCEVSG